MNQNSHTIREIPKEERPYERCKQMGAQALTDSELLAILLRTGTVGESALDLANRVLKDLDPPGLLGLHQLRFEELLAIRGIGEVKAIQLSCISELSKRLAMQEHAHDLCFENPQSVADYYMEDMRHQKQESVKLICLDAKSNLIRACTISKGTANASLVTPREVYIEALKDHAVAIILMHNHPSGDPTPSNEDRAITAMIKKAGDQIGIELLDHIIIGDRQYYSFREQGGS